MAKLVVVLSLLFTTVSAFVPLTTRPLDGFIMRPLHAAPMPSPEESAEALRAYMVKSGERSAKYEKEIQVCVRLLEGERGSNGPIRHTTTTHHPTRLHVHMRDDPHHLIPLAPPAQELKAALAEKGGAVGASSPPPAPAASAITTMGNTGGLTSSAPPATNLAASQKIREYHDFISKYIVNSQLEKQRAVIGERWCAAWLEVKNAIEPDAKNPPCPSF